MSNSTSEWLEKWILGIRFKGLIIWFIVLALLMSLVFGSLSIRASVLTNRALNNVAIAYNLEIPNIGNAKQWPFTHTSKVSYKYHTHFISAGRTLRYKVIGYGKQITAAPITITVKTERHRGAFEEDWTFYGSQLVDFAIRRQL